MAGTCRTPLVEELLIVLHSIQMSANTKQALSARAHSSGTAANALHTPSTIHNQLAQLQDVPSQKQTPALSARAVAPRHAHIHAKKDDGSHAMSSGPAPTPLSRSALQNVERHSAASSLKRHPFSQRSLPVANSGEQHSLPSPSQTEYRNPVFGQVCLIEPCCKCPELATVSKTVVILHGRKLPWYCLSLDDANKQTCGTCLSQCLCPTCTQLLHVYVMQGSPEYCA